MCSIRRSKLFRNICINVLVLQLNFKNNFSTRLITEQDLKVAWDFFDVKGGKLTASQLHQKLSVFYKDVGSKEIKFLLNNQSDITFQELHDLLKDNQLNYFDPVKEAFKVYDPHDTGYVDMSIVKEFFSNLGFGEISDEDCQVVLQTVHFIFYLNSK